MPTTSVGINSQNAGLFSAAAYPDFTGNLPPGWNSVPLSNNSAGVDSFSVFVNPDTQQAVIAFKGTNTPTQAYNDVTSTGAQDYYNIRTLAQTALRKIQSDYSGYQVFTDGHSLGGGMAQSFALENGLSGFGQNSLPVASGTAADPRIFPSTADFNTALQNYRAGLTQDSSGNTAHFNEVNVSGDPATLAYSGGTYLDTSPTTLSSSYSIIEKAGALISRISSAAALGLEAWAMSQAHSIDTVNSLTNANGNQASQTNSSGSVTTQYGDGSASTKVINPVDGSSIVSTVYPNGNASVITYDANQNVTNALIRTFNPTDGTSSAAITDINGTASNTNYDANQQIITTSTVNTATNSGTTQNYTNGVLTSKTDFGAISATTTSYDPVLHVVTGVETVNSDSTASSVKYDPRSGNTIYSSIRDTTGAITTAATNDDGSVTTKHPNGAVSNTTINGAGLPTVYTNNPDGSVSVVAYAELGTPVSMPNGTLSNMTEQTGKVSYSALINLDGSSSSVKYDTDGSATLIQRNADGSGSSMTLHPDGSLNQEIVTQADGTQNTTNYGANNVVSSTAASFLDGSAIVNTFNDNGTPKQQWFTQTDGTVTTTSYGADGLGSTVVQKADGSGCITGYNLDGTSYAKVINTDGSSTTSTWDTLGNLVSEQFVGVTSKSVTYEYVSSSTTFNGSTSTTIITDPFGNVTTTTENHSGIATVCFIPYSSHQTVTNSDGTQISTWYLLDGKVGTKNITYSDGSSLNTVYDQNGNSGIVVATNADGSGNETVVGPNGYSVDFGPGQSPFYLPGRNFISTGEMVQNVYDGRGGLISRAVRYPSGTTLSTSYHTNGRLSSVNISNPNGTLQQTGFNENIYGYLTSPFFTRNWQSPYTLSSMAAYSASYYENGECSSRSISLLDGSSATMSYYFNGVNQSEIVISADGAKGSVYFYSNGQVKDLTHFHADGSVIDSKCYYSDGQLLFKSSYLQDGSLLTERYFSNGLKSSSSWTGRADGASVVYVGYVDGSFSETTYSADGSHVKTTQNSQGDVTTCNFDANGIKLSDSWSKSSGMSGVNSFSADGSSTGTTVFQNGWHSKYTNDGHGDIVTSTFDLNNIQLSSVRSKVDGSSGTDLFNTDGSGSGAAQFANGNNYSYVKNVHGDITYSYHFSTGGNIEIANTINANNTLNFGLGISLADITVGAAIGSDGKPALLLTVSNGNSLIIDDGLNAAINNFSFADGNTLTLNQLMSWANVIPGTVSGNNGDLIFSPYSYDVLVGGIGNDTLVAGGVGATLVGGLGNDTFVVNNSADVVEGNSSGSIVQSSVSYSLADNAKTIKNLTLTGNADLIATGNNLGDVITANSGNDTLIGGTGNDTLIGGAGLDTFGIDVGMGADTVIDTSVQGGVVQLNSALSLSDLKATQKGDDLLLSIIGSTDSMLIKGYYSNSQTSWIIKDGLGNTAMPHDLAAPMRANIAQLESDFISQTKANIIQDYQYNGYTLQADGSLLSNTTSQINNHYYPGSLSGYQGTFLVQHSVSYLNGTAVNYSDQATWVPAYISDAISNTSVSVQKTQISATATEIYAISKISNDTHKVGWATYNFNMGYWISDPVTQNVSVTDNQGNVIGVDHQILTPTGLSLECYGGMTGMWTITSNASSFANSTLLDIVQHNVSNVIQQIDVGNGNHTVYGGTAGLYGVKSTVVNAGSGNNVIYDAGFVYTGTGNDTVINADTVYCGTGNNNIINAGTAYGGSGNDTMIGGNILVAGNGNDLLIGGSTMISGSGNDHIFAGQNTTSIQINPVTSGVDLIGGAGSDSSQVLNAFYQSMGIYDWQVRYQNAGNPQYYLNTESGRGYFDAQTAVQKLNEWGFHVATLQQALDNRWAKASTPLPLPVLAIVNGNSMNSSAYYLNSNVPVVNFAANDYQSLDTLFAQGLLPQHTVTFGQGVVPSDLSYSWGVTVGSISGLASDPQLRYTTLNITWGTNNQSIQVMIPHTDDQVGAGVSQFTFADGTTLGMAQMIAMAPPAPSFDPQIFQYQSGMGVQVMGAGYNSINFGSGITSSMVTLGLGSLMLRVGNNGDVIHITNFDPLNALASNSIQTFNFADGATLSSDQLLARGFDIYGTTGDQTLSGTNLDNRIYAGTGNDTLIGTGANDTLIAGVGVSTMVGGTGNETFVINNTADVIIANANAASNSVLSSVSYAMSDNVQNLTLIGSDNLTATGNGLDNLIIGNAGNDTLIAGGGNDTLIAGSGIATLVGGNGNDTFVINNAADVIIFDPNAASNSVISSVSYVMPDSVQNLTLTGSDNLTATGNAFNNVIVGNAGYDTLISGAGNDTLIAGTGGGTMVGGTGGDVFVLNSGSGQQTIIDNLKNTGDIIQFGAGITAVNSQFMLNGPDLLIAYGTQGDRVLVQGFAPYGATGSYSIGQFQFADGSQGAYTNDGQGNAYLNAYDVNGRLVGDFWQSSDGLHGNDTYNTDGSSSKTTYAADGGYLASTDDGQGNFIETAYNASGVKIGDNWSKSDGSNGSDTFNADGSSSGTIYDWWGNCSSYINDGHGYVLTTNFDATGSKQNDNWSKADGSYGSETFNLDGSSSGTSYQTDGSYSTYTNDGLGNIDTSNFGSDGVKVSDTQTYSLGGSQTNYYDINGRQISDSWQSFDGWYGTDTYNVDGSSSGVGYQPDGSYYTYTNDVQGNYNELDYNASGGKIGDYWNKADGSYGNDVFNVDGTSSGASYNVDGSYSNYTNDGNSNVTTTNFDLNGVKLSDTWSKADGSFGSDAFNADGSGSGTWAKLDGSNGSKIYYADGSSSGAWTKPDGSYGNDIFNADGTSSGTSHNVNGSYSSYTNDGHSNVTTTNFDLNNIKLSDSWSNADGTYGSDVFNADGSSSGTSYQTDGSYSCYINDGHGDLSTSNFNINGVKFSDTWNKVDGSYGNDVFNADGSSSGTSHNVNGSYSSYTNDGNSNVTTSNFDLNGVQLSDAWSNADGTYGNDVFNPDGSGSGRTYQVNGSYTNYIKDVNGNMSFSNFDAYGNSLDGYSTTVNDGMGNVTTTNYDINGNKLSDSWTQANGTTGSDIFSSDGSIEYKVTVTNADGSTYSTDYVNHPNGSYLQSWTKSDGSRSLSSYNAATGEIIASSLVMSAGNSISSDYLQNIGGVNGYNESKASSVYANGTSTFSDYVQNIHGIYGYNETKASSTYADGSSYATDYVQNIGGVYGHNESATTNIYADGSKYNTDYVSFADGSFTQSWNKSDGTAASYTQNSNGSWADSWSHLDGSQGVDAGNNHLLLGSSAIDALAASYGNSLLIGGAGNDMLTTCYGTNIIAFNKGDGQDQLYASSGQNNTLSLGGNFAYSDLTLQKSGNDLLLDVGTSDSITFKNWYAGSNNIVNLQVIASAMSDFNPGSADILRNSNVENFDFQKLVNAFDQAQAANPGLNVWGVTNSLLDAHLSASNSSALGGDLAYVYGSNGNLTGFGVVAAQGSLSNSQFAAAPQTLNPWPVLNTGTAQIR